MGASANQGLFKRAYRGDTKIFRIFAEGLGLAKTMGPLLGVPTMRIRIVGVM